MAMSGRASVARTARPTSRGAADDARLVAALLPQLAISIASAPVLVAARLNVETWTLFNLGAAVLLFGVVYAALAYWFVADARERERFQTGLQALRGR